MLPKYVAEQQQSRCGVILAMELLDQNWFYSQMGRLIYTWTEHTLTTVVTLIKPGPVWYNTSLKIWLSKSIPRNSLYHKCIWHQSCDRKIHTHIAYTIKAQTPLIDYKCSLPLPVQSYLSVRMPGCHYGSSWQEPTSSWKVPSLILTARKCSTVTIRSQWVHTTGSNMA